MQMRRLPGACQFLIQRNQRNSSIQSQCEKTCIVSRQGETLPAGDDIALLYRNDDQLQLQKPIIRLPQSMNCLWVPAQLGQQEISHLPRHHRTSQQPVIANRFRHLTAFRLAPGNRRQC